LAAASRDLPRLSRRYSAGALSRRPVITQPTGYRLAEEQRAQVRDCLRTEQINLLQDQFERFVSNIEASIDRFLAATATPEGTFREMHDALRALWKLSRDDDPPVGQLRTRLQKFPKRAREYIGRRASRVLPKLFPGESIGDGSFALPERAYGWFLDWAMAADGSKLVTAVRVLSADGAGPVSGRSRSGGKHSRARIEPIIAGTTRGGSEPKDRGGRPGETVRQNLVMYLALDWSHATCAMPKPRRSDKTGFGDLVHSVFGWLLPEQETSGAATYALRDYWEELRKAKTVSPLRDFFERHRECLDCRWFENRFADDSRGAFCGRLKMSCSGARKFDAACGPEGALFGLPNYLSD
jgi:hypothetical protein